MAIRRARPISWRPHGLTDARDGTNSFRGAMRALTNLVSDPTTAGVWLPRPASRAQTSSFFGGPPGPGVLSALLVVGDTAYGLVPSSRNPGKDEPFAFDLATGKFLTIQGITAANCPASPPASGDWTPPIMAQVAGRVIVTHPGFPGGNTKFGWFDISGASLSVTGDMIAGSVHVLGKPSVLGLQPGMLVTDETGANIATGTVVEWTAETYFAYDFNGNSHGTTRIDGISTADLGNLAIGLSLRGSGSGIQPGTTITEVSAVGGNHIILSLPTTNSIFAETFHAFGMPAAGQVTGDVHSASVTVDNINFPTSLAVGQGISGAGIPVGATIATVNIPGQSLTLSVQATADHTATPLTIDGHTIHLSLPAAGTANAHPLIVKGGAKAGAAPASPLWGAGDTDRNPLPSVPVGVAQFNGRAYFGLGLDGIVYSDSLLPCRVSNSLAVQALTTNDGLAVTAIAPLMLTTQVVGGIVQALIVFQGANKMQQITGDQATGDLKMATMPVATGTLAPLSATPTRLGLAFISPLGLRFVDFSGTISAIIGDNGQGITAVFQDAVAPSQICAAENSGVLRISVQDGTISGGPDAPYREYWYDIEHRVWSGPHTFPARLIEPWRNSFLLAAIGVAGELWAGDSSPVPGSSFTENGFPLVWNWETVLLPDNDVIAMNAMVEGNLMVAFANTGISVSALDEGGVLLDSLTIQPWSSVGGQGLTALRQRALWWSQVVIFKQMVIRASSLSDSSVAIGNLYLRYEVLEYSLGDPSGNFLFDDTGEHRIVEGAGLYNDDLTQRLTDESGVPLDTDTTQVPGVPA